MEMIVGNVAALSSDWRAWLVAALVTLKALYSAFSYFRCPISAGVSEITPEMTASAKTYQIKPPVSYLLVMLIGIGLAVGGLYMLHDAQYGPLALGAMTIGTFIFITEPSRIFVNSAKQGVFAAVDDPEASHLARGRLRGAHMERAIYEIAIAASVLGVLCLL